MAPTIGKCYTARPGVAGAGRAFRYFHESPTTYMFYELDAAGNIINHVSIMKDAFDRAYMEVPCPSPAKDNTLKVMIALLIVIIILFLVLKKG